MTAFMPYYEWAFKTALYKTSSVKCDCGWNNYVDCRDHGCQRVQAVDALFGRAEQSRAESVLAKLEEADEIVPQKINIMRGDFFEASGIIYPPGSVVVLKLDAELMQQETIEGFKQAWDDAGLETIKLVIVENTPRIQLLVGDDD